MKSILLSAEQELRGTGAISDATCRAFAAADQTVKRGFEASFAFLGCVTSVAAVQGEPVPAAHRVEAIRLMMLRVGAHTDAPRWSSRVLENLVDAALRPPGATVGDIVQAVFAVLAESPPGLSDIQANFIRELAIHVVGKQRRAYAVEDLSWLAAALANPNTKVGPAQAYFAAYTLPPSLVSGCLDFILKALQSTGFEEEVSRDLAE